MPADDPLFLPPAQEPADYAPPPPPATAPVRRMDRELLLIEIDAQLAVYEARRAGPPRAQPGRTMTAMAELLAEARRHLEEPR